MTLHYRHMIAGLAALLIAGCGARPQAAVPPRSPTVAAMVPSPSAAPPTAAPATQPAAVPSAPAAATHAPAPTAQSAATAAPAGAEAPFAYLWPEFVPEQMVPAPRESRIARDDELGQGDIGFYVVTFNGGGRKLIIGGGATEALPITGRITTLRLGERGARLITTDDQRQLVISGYQGTLFVYGVGISEDELVRVAESLRPIDVREMRRRVGIED
jgi:hypothetical protein